MFKPYPLHRRFAAHSILTRKLWLLLALTAGALLALAACAPRPTLAPVSPLPQLSLAQLAKPLVPVADVRTERRALSAEEARDYLGDAVCASCHKDIAALHARSRHAHTLRPVSVAQDGPFFRKAPAVKDPQNGYAYAAAVVENQCALLVFNGSKEASLTADYALGTGHNGYTFLNRDDQNGWVELRLSYYPKLKKWNFTPGQMPGTPLGSVMGREQSGAVLTNCLLCHSTVLRMGDATGLPPGSVRPDMAASHLGIGCERCHGPGRAHVEAAMQGRASDASAIARAKATHQTFGMEDLGRATPQQINTLCGFCHRTMENANVALPQIKMNMPRFQGVALAQSACYQKSGALSCLTCHNSHGDTDQKPMRYEAICLRCHSREGKAEGTRHKAEGNTASSSFILHPSSFPKTCPVNARTGCVGCHMPRQTIGDISFLRYTNHWIKVWPNEGSHTRLSSHTDSHAHLP